jgi:hypothetical protein
MQRMNTTHFLARDAARARKARVARNRAAVVDGETPVDDVMRQNVERHRFGDEMFMPERVMPEVDE